MTTRPRSTAAKLASTALRLLDNTALSDAVGRPVTAIQSWAADEVATIEEQTALVLAVLSLAPPDSPVTRLALKLREQIRVTLAMQRHDTVTHSERRPGWPR